MSIRYFATNRDRENLGRSAKDRDERITLQRGGYHFVDMKLYMSHYLAEVDAKTMPHEANVADSKDVVFDKFLCNPNISSVVICVHGFNVHFHDAQTWFGILTDSLRHTEKLGDKVVTDPQADAKRLKSGKDLVAFIGFSWPSNGSVLSYRSDQTEAIASASALANLIARVRTAVPTSSTKRGKGKSAASSSNGKERSVNLVCHSMGNFLACNMFGQLLTGTTAPKAADSAAQEALMKRLVRLELKDETKENERFFVDRYVMLAADVERRHLTKCVERLETPKKKEKTNYIGPYYSGLEHLVGLAHNFYSRFDGALAVSNVEKTGREVVLGSKGLLDKATLGIFDFLERNPDEKWEQRIGATQQPINAPPIMRSYNAVELSGREIGHSDYVDSKEVVEKIAEVLTDKIASSRRRAPGP